METLSIHIKAIIQLCAAHSVRHLYVFGSVLSDDFTAKSDIDFIVDFLPVTAIEYADNYYDLKFSLETVLNRKVDLLEKTAIKNPYFLQSIQHTKQMLYGN